MNNFKVVTIEELKHIAKRSNGRIDKLYLHWSAGRYGQFFEDYHINIDFYGTILLSTDDFTEVKWHTWHRNTHAIGIALSCCYGAKANQGFNSTFGLFPPTQKQIETMAKVINALCEALDLPITKEFVMTHEEAATIDGYGPNSGDPETRWDLWYIRDYDGIMKKGGEVLRGKAIWYRNAGKEVIQF